ncbi:glycosyltransferase family 4 protein [Leptotrichia sp. oral taxon 417]|jgi:hexosyltransferase|uniref:glycosyltransferase family 4 protein n=1 Tax=Leptotrichia sp. oral taxon 417 TaxID=712365 RepID=UPI0015B991CA|nr:glycosyltransferase family 4 protein [Leptotrichia sp. oral taxon 417]NWO26316.1 glycosyltransferase family 4 protein [Leptotrichia sp. oral taxon 417]
MKKKILFVVQRYGLEVNGGAELHCRQLAERLKDEYDVSVLTTCAIDYVTWKNEYKEGIEHINGVKVIRKKVDFERNQKKFNKISAKLNNEKDNINLGIEWQEAQGPHSSELIKYLEDHKDDYDVIIFLTYLYYTTYFGLKVAPEKSILIPTAHDEPPIYYSIFNETFNLPKAILYSTTTERDFVNKRFKNDYIESDIVGLGVDINENAQDIDLEKTFDIKDDYVVYIGRIDESKGCKEMFEYFLEYKKIYNSNLKLVLAGKSAMEIPGNKDIVTLGFVSEDEKVNLIRKSKLLILPSKFESLSLSTLEAMYLKVPVLLNGKCEVLKQHAILSNGGLYYENKWEFIETLDYLIRNSKIAERMGENGRKYVDVNYKWDVIIEKLKKNIENLIMI